jgi:type VI secretion system protein ImpI
MTLILKIENTENLPKGVPATIRMPKHGRLDIGRNSNLDWTLPDPRRFISGKHCEIHYRAGTYWLYDISTNGTFMNGMASRIKSPQPLNHGDQIAIGIYVITIEIEPETESVKPFLPSSDKTVCSIGKAFGAMPFTQTVTTASG